MIVYEDWVVAWALPIGAEIAIDDWELFHMLRYYYRKWSLFSIWLNKEWDLIIIKDWKFESTWHNNVFKLISFDYDWME